MRRIINILICTAITLLSISCNRHEIDTPVGYNDQIEINLSSAATKVEDTATESYLNHVDILIFNHDGTSPTDMVYHERIAVNGASSSVLSAKKSSFTKDLGYYVQVIANSTASAEEFAAITDYSKLVILKQEDEAIHLTGLNLELAPDYFLMDGVAYLGDTAPATPGTVVLNGGEISDDTVLTVTLNRAAAKIEVFVTAGSSDEFEIKFSDNLTGSSGAAYRVRNLPYESFVLDHDPTTYTKRLTTTPTNSGYFNWDPSTSSTSSSLTVYAYSHNWKDQSVLETEPCIVVNLPMTYTDKTSSTTTEYPNNWYKIPMSANQMFDRNMYYKVDVVVNRPGATSMSEPIELGPINYTVAPWEEVGISVSDANRPKYLAVNRNSMEMYNISLDETTLEFSSSSPVSISVSDVYYIDKFGARVNVGSNGISATAEGLNGNVVINSPLPTNNTILYFTLTLTNTDGETEVVTVMQYPLIYVVNTLSYYSYRDDFIGEGQTDPTTYENLSNANDIVGISYQNGRYTYNTSSSGFFRSKVVRSTYPSTASDSYRGRSKIDGYYWGTGGYGGGAGVRYDNIQDPGNARMYHINIMASSGDYIVGRPKITAGITDPGEDNSKLVSPSFMIASRLAVITVSSIELEASNQVERNKEYLEIYAEHCKQYVEVYEDENENTIHLNDWRLPTAAELSIIYNLQGKESDDAPAIDYLLNAGAYFSASGPVTNPDSNMTGTSVRCVRDVY